MEEYKTITKFKGTDKRGVSWPVSLEERRTPIQGCVLYWSIFYEGCPEATAQVIADDRTFPPGIIVRTNPGLAFLVDIKVWSRLEDRGLGSILLRDVIRECRDRGFLGIWGKLSRSDEDHFDKLKHFYEKHGFTFTIWPEPRLPFLGEIRLEF